MYLHPNRAGSSVRFTFARSPPEGVTHARSTRARRGSPQRGRAAPGKIRVQAGAGSDLVRLLELRDLVLDHLDPRRLSDDVRRRYRERWPDLGVVVLADHLALHPDHRLHDVGA